MLGYTVYRGYRNYLAEFEMCTQVYQNNEVEDKDKSSDLVTISQRQRKSTTICALDGT